MNNVHGAVRLNLAALLALFVLLLGNFAIAAPTFPKLTGRVVDEANILSPLAKTQLEALSQANQQKSTDQLVVVTLNSLQGYEIEEYGYQLGRAWGIGQEKADNGVLLIVAPNERKVRIEVGYGLEGVLTDAITREIIQDKIIPQFKAGNMEQGILDGAQGISEILNLSPEEQAARAKKADIKPVSNKSGEAAQAIIFIIFIFVIIMIQSSRRSRFYRRNSGIDILPIILHDWNDDDDHRGGGGFGGFGGGGSSGSW